MDRAEFLEDLAKRKNVFTWTINQTGVIPNAIRASDGVLQFCPLTAVLYYKTDEYMPSHNYSKCAKLLGIEESLEQEITSAADDFPHLNNSEYKRRVDELRNEMLLVLGLKS